MKRFLLAIVLILCTTGCVNVRNTSKEELIDKTINSKFKMTNKNSSGYKYYLPSKLQSKTLSGYNELLKDKYYEYYLYVDLVSYYNKVIKVYERDDNALFSYILDTKDKFGYINVYDKNNEFLIEAVYNYATIEVKVQEKDVNEAISNVLTVLSSIKYNDDVVKKMMEASTLSSKEEVVDIFEKKKDNDHDYLEEENDVYIGEDEEIDPDIIN